MIKKERMRLYLEEYKSLTLDIMESLNGLGNIKRFLLERDRVLEEINKLEADEEDIKIIGEELKLKELEDEMQLAVKKEKVRIKTKIANLKRMKNGNMKYASSMVNYTVYNGFNKFN